MDKNPKVKKPASDKRLAPSAGAKTPPSEVEARGAKTAVTKAESAEAVREGSAGNDEVGGSRLVDRDGVAYVEGCDTPVWRLEMARRSGSAPEALIAAFPGLTSSGIDLAFAYAQRHRAKLDEMIRNQGGSAMPASEEERDDAAEFETELETLFDKNAEVFRRLAQ